MVRVGGIQITPHSAGNGVALIGTGGNTSEALSLDAKGSGALKLGLVCGAVQISPSGGNVGFIGTTPTTAQSGDITNALVAYGLMTSPTLSATKLTDETVAFVTGDIGHTGDTSFVSVTGLSFSIGASQVWEVSFACS
jgi:hypothetical protein